MTQNGGMGEQMMTMARTGMLIGLLGFAGAVIAGADEAAANPAEIEECLLEQLEKAPPNTSVGSLREYCRRLLIEEGRSVVGSRLFDESLTGDNPFVLTPHKPNYILPVTWNTRPNETPFGASEGSLQNLELKFQLSVKFKVAKDVFGKGNGLYFAYTNQSYWQAYNRQFSSPFRETNHEPEMFLLIPQRWSLLGFRGQVLALGLNHQSNGQTGSLSRSWNRAILTLVLERRSLVFSLRPWYRFPEEEKVNGSATGDDNPDILDYMGNGELRVLYKRGRNTWSLMLRNLVGPDYRGAVELNWGFPIGGRVKGYVQYFNGYGESLIDYNARVNRLGVGIALTDWL